jgi:hypothetical protein
MNVPELNDLVCSPLSAFPMVLQADALRSFLIRR